MAKLSLSAVEAKFAMKLSSDAKNPNKVIEYPLINEIIETTTADVNAIFTSFFEVKLASPYEDKECKKDE